MYLRHLCLTLPATTPISTLSLHDALPISQELPEREAVRAAPLEAALAVDPLEVPDQVHPEVAARRQRRPAAPARVVGLALLLDRKSTRLNSSHMSISYAVFCLKKKTDS